MKKIITKLSLAFLLFLCSKAGGQTIAPVDMLKLKGYYVHSTINGKTYQLFVSLPRNYNSLDTIHYPVLYFLDGFYSFPIIAPTKVGLDFDNEIEHIIVVSIADSILDLPKWFTSRFTDYTPTSSAIDDSSTAADMHFPRGILKSGGAPAFLNTIRTDIIPFIDKQYKTTNDRGIAGHSLGGLFAGYCLLTATDLFNRFGINSPSFWWDKRKMFDMEKSFAEKNSSLNARVFMSVGSMEDDTMVSVMTSFADSLKKHHYKGLTLTSNIFDHETHLSVVPAMISRNMKVLYSFSQREEMKLSKVQLQKFVGIYHTEKDFDVKIFLEKDQLYAQITGQNAVPIFAASETEFFYKRVVAQIQFIKNENGNYLNLILVQDGEKYEGKRIK